MPKLTNKVVKIKKIQVTGNNKVVILPKLWLDEMGWTRQTKLVMELLPHRKIILMSELNKKDYVQKIEPFVVEDKLTAESREKLAKQIKDEVDKIEEVSDIIKVSD